ncbi:hypothetical protein D3C71_249880 [compost metagenome]
MQVNEMNAEKPSILKGLDDALSRLHLAASGSMRASRRKDVATAKVKPRSKKHAARFLETYYAQEPTVDAGVAISEGGLVTLDWVIFRESREGEGTEAIGWVSLTLAEDNSYELEITRHFDRKRGGGANADHVLAQRIARQAEDDDGVCVDCGQHTDLLNEYYHVHDEVWAEAGTDEAESMLCIGCLETRIGRQLTPADFSDAPINYPGFQKRISARQADRLGHGTHSRWKTHPSFAITPRTFPGACDGKQE